jgi:23S rRNA (adenine2503-C2)-methyltransferase
MGPHPYGSFPSEIADYLRTRGVEVSDDQADRIVSHALSPRAAADALKRPLKRTVRDAADRLLDQRRLEVLERVADPGDGFVKYLFKHPDGALSEAVRIPLHKPGTFSVCLSSQVGCAMKCDFCATGRLGLTRNLEPWEIVAQLVAVRDEAVAAGVGSVTSVVFMGQGEPFHNYDGVIRAAQMIASPVGCRLSAEAVTISTVGLVPRIRRYTAEGHRYKLIVSLTSAIEGKRAKLLPVASKYSLPEVADALREHAEARKTRVTVAWVTMSGVNTGADEARALSELLAGVPIIVNLIDVNDARENGYKPASDAERRVFIDNLQILRAPVVRRYSGGKAKHAACGMLAGLRLSA